MTQADTWGDAISGTGVVEDTPPAVNIFSIVQIIVALFSMGAGGYTFLASYGLFVEDDLALVGLLGSMLIIALPMIVIGLLRII